MINDENMVHGGVLEGGNDTGVGNNYVDDQDELDVLETGSYVSGFDDGFTSGDTWHMTDNDNNDDNHTIVIDGDDEVAGVR